jgi:hypothetical protein
MRVQALTVSILALALAVPTAAWTSEGPRGRDQEARGVERGPPAERGGSRREGPERGRDDAPGRARGAQPPERPGPAREVARAPEGGPDRDGRSGSIVRDLARDAQRGRGDEPRERGPGRRDDLPAVVARDARSNQDFREALRDLERRDDRERRDALRDFERTLEGRDLRVVRAQDRDYLVLVRDRDRRAIEGCPPGLAWRNNGCLPPGQARRAERAARYDWVWDRRDDDYRYRYTDGYVYQTRQDGGLAGWLPVLAGALGLNNVWPQQYNYEPVPQYYNSYYGLGDRYDYRYADGVVYGLDPQTSRIQQVTALLTGQPWTVGEQMPRGYDAYNVPYQYRTQYRDTPDSWHRYNDGYVYQVDPTTQLVQAVIQLLA